MFLGAKAKTHDCPMMDLESQPSMFPAVHILHTVLLSIETDANICINLNIYFFAFKILTI